MFFGKTRFSEFQEEKPEMSNKALPRSLRFMEEQGLIEKIEDEYFLTEKGKSLNKLIYLNRARIPRPLFRSWMNCTKTGYGYY